MFHKIFLGVRQYIQEWSEADLHQFNKFIVKNILRHLFRFDNLLPFVAVIMLLALSIQSMSAAYTFIPQSNITAFATFVLMQIAMALMILLVYPFIVIIIFNYIGYRLPFIIPQIFLPVKLFLLLLAFYSVIHNLSPSTVKVGDQFHILAVWFALYFLLMNLYLAFKHHRHPLKQSGFRAMIAVVFVMLLLKPFSEVLYRTSERINYLEINAKLFLPITSCKLITAPIPGMKPQDSNLTVNNPDYYEHGDNGCYLYANTIRLGFASDYIVIFKKNINSVSESGEQVNYYARLNCYSGNCFVEDNIRYKYHHDLNAEMIAHGK